MQTKNKLLTLLVLSAGAAASIAAINKFIKVTAISKNILAEPEALCYKWRFGNIHYTKAGTGKPLLLIHNLNAASSGYEWNQMIPLLQEKYTVYTIDLLGCGRSEKPNMTYTNYLYVQLISDFIKSVIGHRTDIIASGESASIPVMACGTNPELFDQIMLVNPLSLLNSSMMPGKTAKIYKFCLDLPIIGTLIYHIASSRQNITDKLSANWFHNPYFVKAAQVDACYEAAHLGTSPRALYASVKCNYTKCNISNTLKKIDNSIYLVGGGDFEDMEERLNEYKNLNPAIETAIIPDAKALPHAETPTAFYKLVQTYFQ